MKINVSVWLKELQKVQQGQVLFAVGAEHKRWKRLDAKVNWKVGLLTGSFDHCLTTIPVVSWFPVAEMKI